MNTMYSDWTEYFDAVPSSNIINKRCMKSRFNTFNTTVPKDKATIQVENHTRNDDPS